MQNRITLLEKDLNERHFRIIKVQKAKYKVIQKLQIVEQERNNLIQDLRVGEENYKSIIKDHLRLTGVIQEEFMNSDLGNKIIEFEMRKRNII